MRLRFHCLKVLCLLACAVAAAPAARAVPISYQFTTDELLSALQGAGAATDTMGIYSVALQTSDLSYSVSSVGMPDPSWLGMISGPEVGFLDLPGDSSARLVTSNAGFAGKTPIDGAPGAVGELMPAGALWTFTIDALAPIVAPTTWTVGLSFTPLDLDGTPLGPTGVTNTQPLLLRVQFDGQGRLILPDPVVPEPATLLLTALGLGGAAARRGSRRSRRERRCN